MTEAKYKFKGGMKMKRKGKWVVITHLVHCGMCNHEPCGWGLHFSKFTNEKRQFVGGPTIGFLGPGGTIRVADPKKHRILYTDTNASYANGGEQVMVWLEYQEEEEE